MVAGGRRTRPLLLGGIPGRRRNYLIDPAYQIRTSVIAVLGMTLVVGVAAGLLHLLRVRHQGSLRAASDVRFQAKI